MRRYTTREGGVQKNFQPFECFQAAKPLVVSLDRTAAEQYKLGRILRHRRQRLEEIGFSFKV